jgi:hypothetical protein
MGLLYACGTSPKKDKEGYTRWAEKDNGALRKTRVINHISYSLQYITCEYQAIKNAKLNNQLNDSLLKEQIKTCKNNHGQYSFVMVIAPEDKATDLIGAHATSEQEALAIKNYLQFEIGADLKMSTDLGDVPCSMVYYEEMYGLSPNHTFNILFDCPQRTGDKVKISFYDRVFGGGIMNFTFSLNTIENTTLVI